MTFKIRQLSEHHVLANFISKRMCRQKDTFLVINLAKNISMSLLCKIQDVQKFICSFRCLEFCSQTPYTTIMYNKCGRIRTMLRVLEKFVSLLEIREIPDRKVQIF